MGKIFANRIIAETVLYSAVAATTWKAATDAALAEKVASGVITEEQLADLMSR